MRALVAVAMTPGPALVDRLHRIWDRGDAALVVDDRLPPAAADALLDAMAPSSVIDGSGERARAGGRPVADGDAVVVATSGSTGVPKGVVHTHASLAAAARITSGALGVDPTSDRWVCCLPLAHVAGLAVVTRAAWAGVPVEVLPRFDGAVVDDAARDRGATLIAVVASVLHRFDPGGYRRVVIGGAAAPADLPPNAVATYGLTESGGGVVYDGHPLDEVEVRIVDGEVQLRGPMLLRAYRDGTDPRTADGWLPTDDAGAWGEDGRLVVHGRRGELIITGGVNVWPTPVEALLATHPAVAEVAVVGRADPAWGQRVTAIVVPADRSAPPALDELRDHVKAVLHPSAAPQALELVSALPRTALGKVRRADL